MNAIAVKDQALSLATKLADQGINGVGPLKSAHSLADEYMSDRSYGSNHARVKSLIRWETSKNFTTGFVTNLGGVATLPVAVPAALGASWIIQARMCGTIAKIYGHDLGDDRVRTLVLLALLGDAGKEVLKEAGVQIGQKLTAQVIKRVPGKMLIEINKKVGFRLITKAGQTGVINLMKIVPFVGGAVGGSIDAVSCNSVGHVAHALFAR